MSAADLFKVAGGNAASILRFFREGQAMRELTESAWAWKARAEEVEQANKQLRQNYESWKRHAETLQERVA